ncbi:hypothetical protein [Actinoplanes sp. L3-i22]|uniref:hypothetical protein n=1 Tax=Actinoplanes sp. L3-i22 TaxID=2836373 RepID=UPI001C751334|nr:hypothetical protein [Actinoplanes sp. L3-i22]BCY13217.1 hypothetical protein L3i22_083050 [Actinoplanes sp. L3-i22]
MAGGIIYDTNFYAALEAEVNAFRKALTKRWRKEVAAACWENGSFKTAFHQCQAPSRARDWAGDTDRSGWQVHIPGAPSYVNDTTPGDNDTGGLDYETEKTR